MFLYLFLVDVKLYLSKLLLIFWRRRNNAVNARVQIQEKIDLSMHQKTSNIGKFLYFLQLKFKKKS